MMRVNQLLKQNVVDTTAFNELSPQHKDVVREVETTIDKVALKHNVKTDVVYNYIDKEIGE